MTDTITRTLFREHGRRGGKLGSSARMAKMTPEQRLEVSKKANAGRLKKISPARRKEIAKLAAEARHRSTK